MPQSDHFCLGWAANREALQPSVAGLGVDAFDGIGAVPIDQLGDRIGHALPPFLENGRLAAHGSRRVFLRTGSLAGWRVDRRSLLLKMLDVLVGREVAVGQILLGRAAVALLQ